MKTNLQDNSSSFAGGNRDSDVPGMCCPPYVMLTSYRPGTYGVYSTLQLPSLLSLQDILDSDGPSTVIPKPPIPAPLYASEEG